MDVLIPQEALTRIQMEYVEMPGLKLTPKQIGRLCGLPQETCEGALALLLRTGFLRRLSADKHSPIAEGDEVAHFARLESRGRIFD